MNCKWTEEKLLDYSSGRMNAGQAAEFVEHLGSCEGCQESLALQLELDESLEAWTAPAVSEGFDARLLARIEAEREQGVNWWQRLLGIGWGWRVWVPVALAGCLMVVYFATQSPVVEEVAQQDLLRVEELAEAEAVLEDLDALRALHTSEVIVEETL